MKHANLAPAKVSNLFDYYNDFINENGNLGYGFRKVLSEIGEFGNKIKYGIFKSLTNLEIPFITEHLSKDYKKDVIKKI